MHPTQVKYKILYYILYLQNYYRDGIISNEELFKVLKMMTGDKFTDVQLQQIVNRSMLYLDKNSDGKIGSEEFAIGN